jgi:hypothetical protein
MFSRQKRRHTTILTTIEEELEHEGLPTAVETPVANPDQIPFAKQIFDTEKLYRRWAYCCELTLKFAGIGFEHANDLQTRATLWGTFGVLLGSQKMQAEASETNQRAHEVRKYTLYFAALFLAVSVFVTGLYWAVEEGLIGTIIKSISACASSCAKGISSFCSSLKEKTTNLFTRRKKTDPLNTPLVIETKEDKVLVVVQVNNPPSEISQFKEDLFNNPPLLVHSNIYGSPGFSVDAPVTVYPAPSAPPAHLFEQEEGVQPGVMLQMYM